jgi:hypothetical protein
MLLQARVVRFQLLLLLLLQRGIERRGDSK